MHKILFTISLAVMSYNLHAAQNQQPIQVEQKANRAVNKIAQERVDTAFTYAKIKFDNKLFKIFSVKNLNSVLAIKDKIQSLLPDLQSSENCNLTIEQFISLVEVTLDQCEVHGHKFTPDNASKDLFIEYAKIYFTLYMQAKALRKQTNKEITSDKAQFEFQDEISKILVTSGNEMAGELKVTV